MEIILLSKVHKLGNSGEIVHVKSGYARNFLIPKGQAISANKKNIKSFEMQRIKLEQETVSKLILAKQRAEKIQLIKSITISSKAGKEGKIFGSIGVKHIIKEISLIGIKIHKKELRLPNGVLRKIGLHTVIFQPHKEVSEKLLIHVIEKK